MRTLRRGAAAAAGPPGLLPGDVEPVDDDVDAGDVVEAGGVPGAAAAVASDEAIASPLVGFRNARQTTDEELVD
jgi:hypothetical protein